MSKDNKIVCVDKAKGVYEALIDEKKGISLTFTRNEKGQYVPSSKNDTLQNWLLNETGKQGKIEPVKEKAMIHVVRAAEQRLKYAKTFEAKAKAKQDAKKAVSEQLWRDDPASALQQYFQSPEHRILDEKNNPILPKYPTVRTVQGDGMQTVTIALILPDGTKRFASAKSGPEAKRIAATEYGRDVLHIFGTREQVARDMAQQSAQSRSVKTSLKRGYYQMGSVFSVDAEGVVHAFPKTQNQLFMGPDLWMGCIGSTSIICRHNEPVATFGWGKIPVAGNLLDAVERARSAEEFDRIMAFGGGTIGENQFRDALGREISREDFLMIMKKEIEKQDKKASYALYRGKPGTPASEARRCSFLRPITIDEFVSTVDGFLEVCRLDDEIRKAEKKTHGTHGGNRDMLEGKVWDLEEEQRDAREGCLSNNDLFLKQERKEHPNSRLDENNVMTAAMLKALGKEIK